MPYHHLKRTWKVAILALIPFCLIAQEPAKEPAKQEEPQQITNTPTQEHKAEELKIPPSPINRREEVIAPPSKDSPLSMLAAAAIGGLAVALVNAIMVMWGKRADERKSIREMAVQLAIENYRSLLQIDKDQYERDRAVQIANKLPPEPFDPPLIEVNVRRMWVMVQKLNNERWGTPDKTNISGFKEWIRWPLRTLRQLWQSKT